ncbi:Copper resistance protein CopB [Bacillus pseudomycoides]
MKKVIFMLIMSFLVLNSSVNLGLTNEYTKMNNEHFESQGLQESSNPMKKGDPGGGM